MGVKWEEKMGKNKRESSGGLKEDQKEVNINKGKRMRQSGQTRALSLLLLV